MTEPWPTRLFPGVTVEQAERMWPRDPRFRPDLLTLARQARGLTIKEVEEASGVPARRVSRIERNLTMPTDEDKQRLADALDFPLSFFAQPDPVIDFRKQIHRHAHDDS